MYDLSTFEWIELLGWMASALTIATYAMNTMLPLRLLAIASSVCFAIYAAVLQLWPLLVMELTLLPINLYRLWQLVSLRGKVSQSARSGAPDFSVIKAYGRPRTLQAGTVVFEKGDPVDRLYFVSSGKVHIAEPDVHIGAGEIFGEIAFFTDEAVRTATARCTEIARVYEIDEKLFMRLQFEDPSFGLAVMRTMTRRLLENARVALQARAPGGPPDAAASPAQPLNGRL